MKSFIKLILIVSGIAFCANSIQAQRKAIEYYTLPAVYADSLFFEVAKGRRCAELTSIQALQLINLSDLIDSKGKAIELLKTQVNALQGQVYIWEQTYDLNDQQHQAQNKYLKKSILKWKLIAVAEVILIVLVAL